MKEKFKYNPFSGIVEEDINEIIIPRFNLKDITLKIKNSKSLALEFSGKQGRGKTTHLIYLHKQMNEYPIYFLNASSSLTEILHNPSKIIFVDSIHHLNLLERLKLFKAKQVVVYTTHRNRKFECFLAGKPYNSIKFKGINSAILCELLNKRMKLAGKTNFDYSKQFSKNEIDRLIKKFGDNYRGIINYLYEKYQ